MTTTYNALIIDDEPLARQRLRQLLVPYPAIHVVGEASNGEEGLARIEALKPDLLFLDIEMPVLNGFELLGQLKRQPRVVFVTAYDQYALKAFEENSIDYLLKPVEAERLKKTIQKITQAEAAATGLFDLQRLLDGLQPAKKQPLSLTVKLGDRILLIKTADIVAAEAEDKYVMLHTKDGKRHLTDYTLADLENLLSGNFLRIHRSILINTDCISEIRKGFNGSYTFVMEAVDNPRFKSSRSNGHVVKVHLGLA
ncbi:LytR/AlgR family response regulator transcription factor [Parapedobacter koreensis]|uniref:Two component transcriptional regulator, LytTR family n=1 Tax=Parapedobacter koreensis TaxID=332977 RepID=A0A1H7QTK1_9SPHI|nr:response regulator [Parapedobacter koreensis]SEL51340.1 two component transcriptional regulator, LytTR family [Parapedobacter koreensis]